MPPPRFSSLEDFREKTKHITWLQKFKHAPSVKTKVKWQCICGLEMYTPLEKPINGSLCRSCGLKKRFGITVDLFISILEKEGWSFEDDKKNYVDGRTILKVKCNKGHDGATCYNRFNQGGRCKRCMYDRKKVDKNGFDVIQKQYSDAGFELLETSYKTNKEPMLCRCKCGEETKISLGNLLSWKRTQCAGCSKAQERSSIEDIRKEFERTECDLLHSDEELKELRVGNYTKLKYVCRCGTHAETTWKAFKNGVRCSDCAKESRKETNKQIYGFENAAQSEEVKERIAETMNERYGGHHMKVQKFKDIAKATNIRNHGGVHNLATEEIRKKAADAFVAKYGATLGCVPEIAEKIRVTIRERYGVDHALQSKEIRQKIKDNNMEKYGHEQWAYSDTGKAWLRERYGKDTFLHTDDFKRVMIDRYGVEHAAQNPEIFAKMLRSCFLSKEFVFSEDRIEFVQGYEPFALTDLLKEYDESDIVVGCENVPTFRYKLPIENGKDEEGSKPKFTKHTYYPDIYVKSENLIIEVKSIYTFEKEEKKNHRKLRAVQRAGYRAQLWIYDNNGKKIKEILYSDKFQITVVL